MALAVQAQAGIPASLTIAQAALESNWGRSGLTQQANNLFGIKGAGPAGSVTMRTTEVRGGQPVQVDAAFRAYHDWNESVNDYAALLSGSSRYAKALRTDGASAARAVAAAGYATDPLYADKLIALMDANSLYRYDSIQTEGGQNVPNNTNPGTSPVSSPDTGADGGTRAATAQGIDCSTPLTASTARQIASAGYRFAARYLVPQEYKWKRLTRAEAEAITAAGMQIVSVFETTANRAAGGAVYGNSDGAAALREAKAIGQPEGTTIYFAVDYDAQPDDYDAIEAYLKAAAAQIPGYQAGVYASYAVVEEMAKRGACAHFWQTYAWSRGSQSGHANLYQYRNNVQLVDTAVDLNHSYGGEGWWNTKAGTAVPDPNPAPDPNPDSGSNPEEGEITMTKEDAEKIIRFLSAAWFASPDQAAKDEFNRLANEVRKAAGIPPQ